MKNNTFLSLITLGLLFFVSCNDDNPTPDDGGGDTATDKYVLMTMSERAPVGPGYATAFDEFPNGTISNIVGGKSLSGSGMAGFRTYGNWVFKMYRTAESERVQGLEKLGVATDGTITVSQFITPKDVTAASRYFGTGNFVILNETSGFYWDGSNPLQIQKFNPTTMSNTGSIDLASAVNQQAQEDETVKFRAIGQKFLAIKNGKLFANITYSEMESGQAGFFDDSYQDDVHIAVIDIASESHEKTIKIENTSGIAYINENPMYDFDTNGDLYIVCQGPVATGGKSKIARIKANETEIDGSWELNFSDFRAADDGKFVGVYADQGRLIVTLNTIPLTGGQTGNINSADIWKFYSIDVADAGKTFNAIEGVPTGSNPGAAQAVVQVDGKTLLRGSTINYADNGYYEYNFSTNSATKLFQVSEGGGLSGFVKIAVE